MHLPSAAYRPCRLFLFNFPFSVVQSGYDYQCENILQWKNGLSALQHPDRNLPVSAMAWLGVIINVRLLAGILKTNNCRLVISAAALRASDRLEQTAFCCLMSKHGWPQHIVQGTQMYLYTSGHRGPLGLRIVLHICLFCIFVSAL